MVFHNYIHIYDLNSLQFTLSDRHLGIRVPSRAPLFHLIQAAVIMDWFMRKREDMHIYGKKECPNYTGMCIHICMYNLICKYACGTVKIGAFIFLWV